MKYGDGTTPSHALRTAVRRSAGVRLTDGRRRESPVRPSYPNSLLSDGDGTGRVRTGFAVVRDADIRVERLSRALANQLV
ncbi:hypothetical protein GCM10009000_040470 [Halobacterium noricense]